MEKLNEKIKIKGTGLTNLTAKLVKRHGRLCIYKRSDNVFEVFYPKRIKESVIKDVIIPAHEAYPKTEDFGKTAWCFSHEKNAERFYASKLP